MVLMMMEVEPFLYRNCKAFQQAKKDGNGPKTINFILHVTGERNWLVWF